MAVAGGIFSILLGESPQPTLSLAFDIDYWLQVTFNGVTQTPRQRLASAGYAYMASGLVAGTEVSGTIGAGSILTCRNFATSGFADGLYAVTESTQGRGVYGYATATSGEAYGVYGMSTASAGAGVYGMSPRTDGRGVYGEAAATTGVSTGVYGITASSAGRGVYGNASATSGTTHGVYGRSTSTSGRGVYGYAAATSGYTYGVYGRTESTDGRGVYGTASALSGITYGVFGQIASTDGGHGVYGRAIATLGFGDGVYGESACTYGHGVYGVVTHTTGDNAAVCGECYSVNGIAVRGVARATWGVGVKGWAGSSGGYGVYSVGDLAASGSKSCVVKTSQGPTLLYCQESPESWFEDVGGGQLIDGRAHVALDPLFLETVTVDAQNALRVFVELGGDCNGIYVVKGATGFDVIELRGGTSSVAFDYRVMAKRKGFEAKRLDVCEAARTDSYLYPELRELEADREYRDEERTRMKQDWAGREAEGARMEGEPVGTRR